MDLNTVRSIVTLASFLIFVGIVWWAYSGRRKDAFEEAANLPFADDDSGSVPALVRPWNSGSTVRNGERQ